MEPRQANHKIEACSDLRRPGSLRKGPLYTPRHPKRRVASLLASQPWLSPEGLEAIAPSAAEIASLPCRTAVASCQLASAVVLPESPCAGARSACFAASCNEAFLLCRRTPSCRWEKEKSASKPTLKRPSCPGSTSGACQRPWIHDAHADIIPPRMVVWETGVKNRSQATYNSCATRVFESSTGKTSAEPNDPALRQ